MLSCNGFVELCPLPASPYAHHQIYCIIMGYEDTVTRRLRRALILTHDHHASNVCCNYHRCVSQTAMLSGSLGYLLSAVPAGAPGDWHTRTPDAPGIFGTHGCAISSTLPAPPASHRSGLWGKIIFHWTGGFSRRGNRGR